MARTNLKVLWFSIFVTMLGVGLIVPFLPLYAKQMGASATMLGLIFSAFALARLVAMPLVGVLSDRHGRRRFMLLGLAGLAVTSLGLMLAESSWALVLARGSQGAFSALVLPVSMALLGDVTPPGTEGRAFGKFNVALLLGFGVGPLLGGAIYEALGVGANFLMMTGLSLLGMLLVAWKIYDPPQRKAMTVSVWGQFRLLQDAGLMGVFICRCAAAMAMGFFVAFLPLLAVARGLDAAQVGLLLTVNVLVMTVVQRPAGIMADRMDRAWLASWAQLLTGVAKALMPLAGGIGGLLALVSLEGLVAGLGLPALTALTVDHGRRLGAGMGVVMGLFTMALSLGVFLGPMLGGVVIDFMGLNDSFYLLGALAALGSIALRPWRRQWNGGPGGDA